MSCDLIEAPAAYHVTCDLPGIPMDKLEVSVQDNCLVIVAERQIEHDKATDMVHSMERSFGKVSLISYALWTYVFNPLYLLYISRLCI
jgi:HSP20 family molecular chaperone IbpA